MNVADLLNTTYIALAIALVGAVGYLFFTKAGAKAVILKVLPFLPGVLRFLSSKFEDKKGEFDTHDLSQLTARAFERLNAALQDESNASLEDLQEEVRDGVVQELETYRRAGFKNVPEADAEEIEYLVELLFSNLKAVLGEDNGRPSEDQSGNDQQN
jgi:hypothetical protein